MGVLIPRGPFPRRRFDNLREIRALDPEREADRDRIVVLTSRHEFPWDYTQGTGIAFLRDYGIPSISRLLDRTREFEEDGVKRYDDTLALAEESVAEGVDSSRSHAGVRRLNQIHGHYEIPNDEFRYVLATTLVGPVRWIELFGWRRLDPVELRALASFTTRFGTLMGIKDLPTTYAGYAELLDSYEREHFAFDPANRRVTEATLRIARRTAPWPLRPVVRRLTIALMDEPLRAALGMPRQPAWFVQGVRVALRARGRLLRLAPPRRTAYVPRPVSYPDGYSLRDIGPASMIDELNAHLRADVTGPASAGSPRWRPAGSR
jgi:ER-bound oxygenase mpaB/B'/Rubber oxygenase, catalytic domain